MLLSATGGRPGRLGALDVLRFAAAAAVVGFHFLARDSPAWGGAAPEEVAAAGAWAAYGRLGVPLFFVISGFVILMSSWGRDVPDFVASRVGRLYPAFWVSVVLSVVISVVLWPAYADFFGGRPSASEALLNTTMVQQAFGVPSVSGVYWTLWYEARFYLLIAVLVLVGLTRRRVLAFAALWPLAGAMAAQADSELLTTLLIPGYAPFFAGGMLLHVLYRDVAHRDVPHRGGHDLGVWLLLGLQVAIAVHSSVRIHRNALTELTPVTPSTAVIAVLTVACFGLVALATLTRAVHWNARWMVRAGALTYPVYLLHENLGWYVIAQLREVLGAWGAVAAAVVVSLVASALLHRFVEQPFGPRLRRLTLEMLRRTPEERDARVVRAAAREPDAPLGRDARDAGSARAPGADPWERTLVAGATRMPPPPREEPLADRHRVP